MAAVMGVQPPNEKQSKGVARRRRLQHQRSNANHMLWYMRQLQAGAAHHTSQRTGHDAVAMAANLEALLAAGKDLLVLMDAKLNTFKATCNSDMTRATKNPAEEENEAPLRATNAETQKSDVIEGYVAVESDFAGASAQMGADDNKDTVEVTEQQATEPKAMQGVDRPLLAKYAGDPATELAHCAARAPHLVGAVASSSVDGGVVAGEEGALDDAETLAADGEDGVEQQQTSEGDESEDDDEEVDTDVDEEEDDEEKEGLPEDEMGVEAELRERADRAKSSQRRVSAGRVQPSAQTRAFLASLRQAPAPSSATRWRRSDWAGTGWQSWQWQEGWRS